MYRGRTVGVVVPAYNEEGRVGDVVETLPALVDRAYVVDDGSTDGTWAEIQAAAAADELRADQTDGFDRRVVPVRHTENRGVGGAIKTGYRRALADGIDVTAVMGGDGQMDPGALTSILDPVIAGEADYAKGNRFLAREDLGAMPRFRLVGNLCLTLLTKIASGYWGISDPQNGYTAISQKALREIDLDGMFEYYGYCNDLLVRLNEAGLRVADVVHSAQSVYGEDWDSHITYTEYVPRVSAMLLRGFLWRQGRTLRRGRPMALAYALGLLAWFAAIATLAGGLVPGAAAIAGGAVGTGLIATGGVLDAYLHRDLSLQVAHRQPVTRPETVGSVRASRQREG
jgi:glycosyltransferase involved in cell wall biosynthesis